MASLADKIRAMASRAASSSGRSTSSTVKRMAPPPKTDSWITRVQEAPRQWSQPNYGQNRVSQINPVPIREIRGQRNYTRMETPENQRVQREAEEQNKREELAAKIRKANDPEEDWRGHRAKAPTIFRELSQEDYDNLDPRQRAAVDFNTALETALNEDRKTGHLSTAMVQSATDKDDWSDISAPLTKALMDDLKLSGPGTDFRDFVSGKVAISAHSLENMNEGRDNVSYKRAVRADTRERAKDAKTLGDFTRLVADAAKTDSNPPEDWKDARRDRDAILAEHVQSRMAEIFKENRTPGKEGLKLSEESEDIFGQLYAVLSGYQKNEMGAPVTDREGKPIRFEINPGEIVETLDDFGLAGEIESFSRYVDVRLREELNDEETEEVRRKFLSQNAADMLKLAREG